jgi:RNA polymerase sigma-70 factor (ECF subfamily)
MEHAGEFDQFFVDEFRKIVRTVMLAGAGFEDASDAVHEAMILAHARFGSLDRPAAWVRRVAVRIYTRKAVRALQVRRREQLAAQGGKPAQPDDDSLVDVVRAVLEDLPPVQRMVLALTIDGYTPAEIASIVDRLPATVRTNLRHARRAMAAGLRKGGFHV